MGAPAALNSMVPWLLDANSTVGAPALESAYDSVASRRQHFSGCFRLMKRKNMKNGERKTKNEKKEISSGRSTPRIKSCLSSGCSTALGEVVNVTKISILGFISTLK